MGQFSNVQLVIDKGHTVPLRVLDWRPSWFMVPSIPLPLLWVSVASISTSLPDAQIGINIS